eukprot:148814-Prorocentrum_minimum.AAC.1
MLYQAFRSSLRASCVDRNSLVRAIYITSPCYGRPPVTPSRRKRLLGENNRRSQFTSGGDQFTSGGGQFTVDCFFFRSCRVVDTESARMLAAGPKCGTQNFEPPAPLPPGPVVVVKPGSDDGNDVYYMIIGASGLLVWAPLGRASHSVTLAHRSDVRHIRSHQFTFGCASHSVTLAHRSVARHIQSHKLVLHWRLRPAGVDPARSRVTFGHISSPLGRASHSVTSVHRSVARHIRSHQFTVRLRVTFGHISSPLGRASHS